MGFKMTKHVSDDTALVTVGQVAAKQAQLTEKLALREEVNFDIANLEKWLEAAALISGPEILKHTVKQVESDEILDSIVEDENMAEAVKRILAGTPKPLANRQLQDELRKTPRFAERLNKNPNYYYTLVSRLVGREEIQRFRKKLRLPKTETAGC
jgi:hypothetical protein